MVPVACFVARVSVMFQLMFVHYTFCSVLVAWEIAANSVGHFVLILFCLFVF